MTYSTPARGSVKIRQQINYPFNNGKFSDRPVHRSNVIKNRYMTHVQFSVTSFQMIDRIYYVRVKAFTKKYETECERNELYVRIDANISLPIYVL